MSIALQYFHSFCQIFNFFSY
uniref:Uncharacterized protein n=1 Tax=Anguilla anguilla TaxID=7936 RepID=A0A0E9SP43_ANGAN